MDIKDINSRFIDAYNYLNNLGKVQNKSRFAYEIGVSPQIFTEILGGRMNVSPVILQKLFDTYKISYDFIFFGLKPIILPEESSSILSEPKYDKQELQLFKERLADKEQLIESLKKQVANLEEIIRLKKAQ